MLPQSAADYYRAQQRLVVATLAHTRSEWAKMGADFDASWANIAPRVELLTASAQLGAARNGAAYVPAVLSELGQSVDPLGLVNPNAFAGIASDGRPLGSLLEGAKIHAKRMNSLEAGGKWLDMAVHTQVQDAARGATAVQMMVRPGVGYVRVVNPPCCGPCAVLAGKHSRPTAFKRHPRCDCFAVPSTDPRSIDLADPSLDQIKGLSAGEHGALKNGADLSRVINSRRGSSGLTTTELAKRGKFRLTPDGIMSRAKSRDEMTRLLREHGYITNAPRTLSLSGARTTAQSISGSPKWKRLSPAEIRASLSDGTALGNKVADQVQRAYVSGTSRVHIETAMTDAQAAGLLSDVEAVMERAAPNLGDREITFLVPRADRNFAARKDGGIVGGYVLRGGSTVHINPRIALGEVDSTSFNNLMPASKTTGYRRYTLTHELGHLIDFEHAHSFGGGKSRIARETVSLHRSNRAALSTYGQSSALEGYAESYAQWTLGGPGSNAAADAYARTYGWK